MNRYKFSIATENEEVELRQMLRDNPVSSRISISFEREPNFFYAASVGNKFRQVLVCKDSKEGRIIGIGMRSIFDAYVNGAPISCGYLSSLRINPTYRRQTILSRGYNFIHDLHHDGKARIYLTTIISDNVYAKHILTGRRAGLPSYEEYGSYYSYIIPLKRSRHTQGSIKVIKAKGTDMQDVVDCLQRNGKQKQFYPVYSQETFESNNGFLRDFHFGDFFLAFKDNRLIGVMGMWDQLAYKQFIIKGYSPLFTKVRPFYNRIAEFLRFPKIPDIGKNLAICYAFAIAIDSNDAEVFEQLLTAVYNESGKKQYDYLAIGLHSRDPFCKVARSMRHFLYKSNLYVVHWEDGMKEFGALNNRVPYLEIATL